MNDGSKASKQKAHTAPHSSITIKPESSTDATAADSPELRRRSLSTQGTPDRDDLFKEFQPLVNRLIRQYGHDPELRKDLIGEVYCLFCGFYDAYDPQRGVPLRPYLVRQLTAATYTFARSQWQRHKREVAWEGDKSESDLALTVDPTPVWVQELSRKAAVTALPEALKRLPERQRQVVKLRYFEGRSFEEIAQLLSIQTSTARSLLRHGLDKLRKHLAASYG